MIIAMTTTFERMLNETRQRGYNHALTICRNPDLAEELVQEACRKAWLGRNSYWSTEYSPVEFKTWFLTIVSRVAVDDYRKTKTRKDYLNVQPIVDQNDDSFVDHRDFACEIIDNDSFEQKLRFIEQNLNPIYSDVFLYYFLTDSSYEQVAEHFGMGIGTVRSRIFRARKLLMQNRERFMAA